MRQFENPDYARRTLTPALVIATGADRIVATPAIEAFASVSRPAISLPCRRRAMTF